MVNCCAIASCRNITTKEKSMMLHRISYDKIICDLWIKAIQSRQPSFCDTKKSCVCSHHFVESDYNVQHQLKILISFESEGGSPIAHCTGEEDSICEPSISVEHITLESLIKRSNF
ncbi:uncharacterized protein LOC126907659 [Daktulosphaira vitifoliae]|uniref:uncharacterized protein LOC126907659 n=1 Tax=Daktulosphaira vitifoliae TaxID=58002 RepID=UPI0021AAFC46|nr:uncharacterized protein LOC126907659 [Daktulosphaira vitifoliae]